MCIYSCKRASPKQRVADKSTFEFYKNLGEPLHQVAFNLQDLRKKIESVPAASLEFHQKRGDFAKWIRDISKDMPLAQAIEKIDKTGEDLRSALSNSLNSPSKAVCPSCGTETTPVKTWKMAGRPNKTGERLQLTIAHCKCPKCDKTFRKAIAKERIRSR
jgi:hypothetical protein